MNLFGITVSEDFVRDLVLTALLVVAVVVARSLSLRAIRRTSWGSDAIQLRWAVQVRWGSLLVLAFGLLAIWAAELQTLAVSIVAIAAAVVIATKELILCVSGSVLRTTSSSFSVGDRIEIAGIRGDVVDLRPLTTTILEIGPGHRRTGRVIVLPNAAFLSSPLINETFTDEYVVHIVSVPIKREEDVVRAESALLEAAQEVSAPYLEDVKAHIEKVSAKQGVPAFAVEPRVSMRIPKAEELELMVRIPTRARDKGQTENDVIKRFLELTRSASVSTQPS